MGIPEHFLGQSRLGERPERKTLFERDAIGRLIAKLNRDVRQDFEYDHVVWLLCIQRTPTIAGKQLGVTDKKLEYAYDLLAG